MRNLVPDYDDFADAVWDFDETLYNDRNRKKEDDKSNEELSRENLE